MKKIKRSFIRASKWTWEQWEDDSENFVFWIFILFVGILCSLAIARGNKLTNAERIPPAFVNTNNVPVAQQGVLRRALEAYRQETGRDPLDLPLEEYSEYIRNYIRDNTLPMLTVADAARDYDDYDEDDEEAPRPSDIDRDW
jgi:hypothetical protein